MYPLRSVQLDEGLAERVEQFWRQAQLGFESPVQALVLGLGQIIRDELQDLRRLERLSAACTRVLPLQRLLESIPDSDSAETQLAQAQQELQETQERSAADTTLFSTDQ